MNYKHFFPALEPAGTPEGSGSMLTLHRDVHRATSYHGRALIQWVNNITPIIVAVGNRRTRI